MAISLCASNELTVQILLDGGPAGGVRFPDPNQISRPGGRKWGSGPLKARRNGARGAACFGGTFACLTQSLLPADSEAISLATLSRALKVTFVSRSRG